MTEIVFWILVGIVGVLVVCWIYIFKRMWDFGVYLDDSAKKEIDPLKECDDYIDELKIINHNFKTNYNV
jgi:hypothetical protein